MGRLLDERGMVAYQNEKKALSHSFYIENLGYTRTNLVTLVALGGDG